MLIYAVGVCLFVPGTVLTGLGAALFGILDAAASTRETAFIKPIETK